MSVTDYVLYFNLIYDICMIETKQVSERVIARYGMFPKVKRKGHL